MSDWQWREEGGGTGSWQEERAAGRACLQGLRRTAPSPNQGEKFTCKRNRCRKVVRNPSREVLGTKLLLAEGWGGNDLNTLLGWGGVGVGSS